MPGPKDTMVDVDMLNLLCAEGVREVPLTQVQRLRFLNPSLDGEFRRALEVLAAAHNSQKRTVSLNFAGEGKRTVKVGYVVENPIWKTSYRLVLDKKGKPALQGWAIVENTSDEDWKDVTHGADLQPADLLPNGSVSAAVHPAADRRAGPVRVAAAADLPGRPQRPGGRPTRRPRRWAANSAASSVAAVRPELRPARQSGRPATATSRTAPSSATCHAGRPCNPNNDNNNAQNNSANPKLSYEEMQQRRQQLRQNKDNAKKIGSAVALDPSGVASVANADEIGDYFQYAIDQKVTLPRQKSAMLPIVNQPVEGKRVSIYNEAVQAKFPLLGLRFKNTTGQDLMQGPVAVYEGGTYAGDGRIMDLQPNEERLLSFAIDQGVEIKAEGSIGAAEADLGEGGQGRSCR